MSKAFTLIELLIVVAIIAILAAIAVPNFLEAQVRSKVSRCKADQRSIAVAIESYTADWNMPPLSKLHWKYFLNVQPTISLYRVTTPVAYITKVPGDIFVINGTVWGSTLVKDNPFDYQSMIPSYPNSTGADGSTAATINRSNADWEAARGWGYTWAVTSDGPSRSTQNMSIVAFLARFNENYRNANPAYDPTNGVKSFGKIMRTNAGQKQDVPYPCRNGNPNYFGTCQCAVPRPVGDH